MASVDVGPFTVIFSSDLRYRWTLNVKCLFGFHNDGRYCEPLMNCAISVSGLKREGSSHL